MNMQERIRKWRIDEISNLTCTLCEQVTELKERHRMDMWQEVIDYLNEEKERET